MARTNPHRRIIVTTFNTALATAAVTATAAGWAAFGMADSSSAAAAQTQSVIVQPIPSAQQPLSSRRHHDDHERFSFGGDDGNRFSQSQQQPAFGNSAPASGSFGQSQQSAPSSSFSQAIPQPRQPITRSRSSR